MTESFSDLVNLARGIGLPADRATVAAAIAMAESGGNPNAHNNNAATGDDSYGLWQINMIGSLGVSRRKQWGLSSNNELFDPKKNATAMALISLEGLDFSAWSTYKSGAYKQFMPAGAVTPPNQTGVTPAQALTDATSIPGLSALDEVTQLITKVSGWVTNTSNWVRVAYVVGGGVIVVVGLAMVIGDTKAGQTAVKAGKTAAKAGALL